MNNVTWNCNSLSVIEFFCYFNTLFIKTFHVCVALVTERHLGSCFSVVKVHLRFASDF